MGELLVERSVDVGLPRKTVFLGVFVVMAGWCVLASGAGGQWHDIVELPVIYTMDRDGSNVQLLAKVPGMKWHGSPNWSHDGKKVAFDATPIKAGWGSCRIFVVAVENPSENTVKDLGPGSVPTWSPDDKKIAYVGRGNHEGRSRWGLYVMNPDGSGKKWLTRGGFRPRWSPDGKKIVLSGLNIVDVESREATRILTNEYRGIHGATWSPDSKRLTFIGVNNSGKRELCIVGADGAKKSLRVLLRANIGGIPSWSPDGKQIAFWLKNKTGARHLHAVVDPDAPGPPELVDIENAGVWNADPEWSPDGKKIVFCSDRDRMAPQNQKAPAPQVVKEEPAKPSPAAESVSAAGDRCRRPVRRHGSRARRPHCCRLRR